MLSHYPREQARSNYIYLPNASPFRSYLMYYTSYKLMCVWYSWIEYIAIQLSGHGCTNDLTTEHGFVLQASWVIDVLGLLFFWHVIKVRLYNRHCQTPARLVQELNVCTVRVSLIDVFGCLCNEVPADVWSTGAGTKCLYCTCIIDRCVWLFV